jgi:hypothetical protein
VARGTTPDATRWGANLGDFGSTLRRHRQMAGLGLRGLAPLIHVDYSYLGRVERGECRPTEKFARRCDDVLAADGALVQAWQRSGGSDVHRRTLLGAMGALAVAPTVSPAVNLEALRHGFGAATGDVDEWERIVADYGHDYYRLPPEILRQHIADDLTVLQHQLPAVTAEQQAGLLRAAASLSVMIALSLVASGHSWAARRWWGTARRVADESAHRDTQVLVRAWDVVIGCYDDRPPGAVVTLSDEALPLLDGRASAAGCGLLAGRAQALALAGRHREAVATVRELTDLAGRLPDRVAADVESLWGWPEHRVHHTASWVYTHAGRLADAETAQEQALHLYPQSQARLRTQVQLHQAACLVRGGHIPDGLVFAADLLDGLPPEQRTNSVRVVARQVAAAVPEAERKRPVFGELTARVGA